MSIYPYIPKRAFIEPDALKYPLGQKIYKQLSDLHVPIIETSSHNRITGIPGKTPTEKYYEGKNTLVIGIKRGNTFQTCKPSAHYQLPLTTSCPGKCEYCYLNTTLGKKPYLRVYVNVDEILDRTKQYIIDRLPETTVFEGAATSDPLPTEPFTGSLAKTIKFFSLEKNARFRFVTKFTNVDSLLNIDHQGNTRFRFSLNSNHVINSYEHSTASLKERIKAAHKVSLAGYPLGFIIGPIMQYEGYQNEYTELFEHLSDTLNPNLHNSLAFEFITHRFTSKAKNQILEVFPSSTLPMDEVNRQYKYGQFGYGKYIYPKDKMKELRVFFENLMAKYFPQSEFTYFV
ncbi:spore photoproduct lyase [Desulfonispora thiosulfatigenes DSM 11270]|uniref:Spore photoproduct lyase n=1 Tax=Desulfonispora thiosulfatigenes DSM 11270 TaxID=656914 RepID=A0A1W1VTR8_DESTI|nr:spore photoproduct lyase [Desulfonispora thiosulfatigenes]SMB96501.1 spore photoproduct lyase [Desulfonispora thiosulfatigenes DSM 11270]